MSGTNDSTGGFRRITRRLGPPVKIRLVGFSVVTLFGGLLLAWLMRTTWQQLALLQQEHAAVQSEQFYVGVHLRGAVRNLSDVLLRYGLTRDPAARLQFVKESAELKQFLAQHRGRLIELSKLQLLRRVELSKQTEILGKAERAFDSYVIRAEALLGSAEGMGGPGSTDKRPLGVLTPSFSDYYLQTEAASRELLGYCDEFVIAQDEGFGEFLAGTQQTLVNHQRLLQLSSVLLLTLAGTLAVLVYRGLIAPLRLGLDQSKTIIERQEKLASLGVLASGVAHEIRNPLTAIKVRLFSARKSNPALAANEDLGVIGDEINRLEGIVRHFLQFAKPAPPALSKISAAAVLEDVRQLMAPPLERTAIHLQFEPAERALVHADPQQLKQVLINLVRNSAESIGRNGTITLQLQRGQAELEGRLRPVAILGVRDTGRGISPEVEARLFDPFFTTKERGTGLGLAIASRIVEQHGGMLRYETELNRGSTFEIVLPSIEADVSYDSPH